MDIQGEAKVAVAGLEGPFERDELIEQLAQVGEATGCTLQAFDPDAVYGPEHLEAAARKALRAHREGRALARDLAAEIACYAAGTHQIKEALATTGLPQQGDALAVVAIGREPERALEQVIEAAGFTRSDELLAGSPAVLDRLGIPASMREQVGQEAWAALVLEQVALLDAEK